MGELSDAYEFIDRNLSVADPMLKLVNIGYAAEASLKSFLAGRDGIRASALELNEKYEIAMYLVPRQRKLSKEGRQVIRSLNKAGLLQRPAAKARQRAGVCTRSVAVVKKPVVRPKKPTIIKRKGTLSKG